MIEHQTRAFHSNEICVLPSVRLTTATGRFDSLATEIEGEKKHCQKDDIVSATASFRSTLHQRIDIELLIAFTDLS